MSKEKSPAFQFYPRDLLSDINWRMMNYPERGMYWELVSVCWLEGSLPSDLGSLSRLLQVTPEQLESAWRMIGRCFNVSSEDSTKLVHPRLELERLKQSEWLLKCAKGGRASAHKRKSKKTLDIQQSSCDLLSSKRQVNVKSSSSSSSAINNTPYSPPMGEELVAGKNGDGVEERFGIFWSAYPRHEAKQNAKKSWLRLAPSDELLASMISWINRAKKCDQWQDRNKIPFPATWLNQRRWEDDIPPVGCSGKANLDFLDGLEFEDTP